jgi:hypothetical protein
MRAGYSLSDMLAVLYGRSENLPGEYARISVKVHQTPARIANGTVFVLKVKPSQFRKV